MIIDEKYIVRTDDVTRKYPSEKAVKKVSALDRLERPRPVAADLQTGPKKPRQPRNSPPGGVPLKQDAAKHETVARGAKIDKYV